MLFKLLGESITEAFKKPILFAPMFIAFIISLILGFTFGTVTITSPEEIFTSSTLIALLFGTISLIITLFIQTGFFAMIAKATKGAVSSKDFFSGAKKYFAKYIVYLLVLLALWICFGIFIGLLLLIMFFLPVLTIPVLIIILLAVIALLVFMLFYLMFSIPILFTQNVDSIGAIRGSIAFVKKNKGTVAKTLGVLFIATILFIILAIVVALPFAFVDSKSPSLLNQLIQGALNVIFSAIVTLFLFKVYLKNK